MDTYEAATKPGLKKMVLSPSSWVIKTLKVCVIIINEFGMTLGQKYVH